MSRIIGLRANAYALGFVIWLAIAVVLPVARALGAIALSWWLCVAPGVLLMLFAAVFLVGCCYLNHALEKELFAPARTPSPTRGNLD